MDDEKIKEFCNITGAGAQVAQQLLQVCNGNLEMAINMHMEGTFRLLSLALYLVCTVKEWLG